MKYALLCQMLPDPVTKEVKLRMGSAVYDSEQEAQEVSDQARRGNLPYTSWVVSFSDPRELV